MSNEEDYDIKWTCEEVEYLVKIVTYSPKELEKIPTDLSFDLLLYVMIYDVADRSSYDEIVELAKKMREKKDVYFNGFSRIIFVGNTQH